MKDTFGPFYEEDFPGEEFWDSCTFSFDANVLLNLYKLSPPARESFLKILSYIENRVFLTHQAALEYHRRIDDRIKEQLDVYNKNNIVKDLVDRRRALSSIEHHPFCDFSEIAQSINELIPRVMDLYRKAEQKKQEYRVETQALKEQLASYFSGKVGAAFSDDELFDVLHHAQMRYQLGRPPGFEDGGKNSNSAGDVIVWFQLMKRSNLEEPKRLTFVTDDSKADWWKSKSPHPELITEMRENGIEFFLLNSKSFLRKLPRLLSIDVDVEGFDMAAEELSQIVSAVRCKDEERDPLSMSQVLRNLGSDADLFWDNQKLSGVQCAAIEDAFTARLQQICASLSLQTGGPNQMLSTIGIEGLLPPDARAVVEEALELLRKGRSGELPYKSEPTLEGADRILSTIQKRLEQDEE